MSDMPPAGPPPLGPAGFRPAPVPPGPWPPMMPMRRPSRWPTIAALLFSLAALGISLGAWLRPIPEPRPPAAAEAPTFTDQQVADAKAKVCDAYAKVRRAVDANWTRTGGENSTDQLAVAVNMRQVYIAGSVFMLKALDGEPAAPQNLSAAVRELSGLYQVIALDGLASDESVPAHDSANEAGVTIESLCR